LHHKMLLDSESLKLIEVVPTRRFEKRPAPGMRVTLDNRTGTVEERNWGARARGFQFTVRRPDHHL